MFDGKYRGLDVAQQARAAEKRAARAADLKIRELLDKGAQAGNIIVINCLFK